MERSTVLKTLPVGRVVFLIGETDGWLKVRDADGTEGWVGATLLAPSDEPITPAVAPVITPTPVAPSPSIPMTITETSSTTTDWYDQDHSGELSPAAPPGLARANYPSGCYVDPVPAQDFRVKISIGARVRDGACMVGTVVKKTLPVSRIVQVIASTDGWYKVRDADGVEGWIGATLATKTDSSLSDASTATPTTVQQPVSSSLASRVVGRILLQVENHGEAWYVNPSDKKRYYMKDGPTAYEMMRTLSLGINNANFDKLSAHDASLVQRLKGLIVLKVEDVGKAYYVHPDNGSLHYLKDGAAAYELMRTLSLGITNRDLDGLPSATLVPKASTQSPTPVTTPTPTTPAPTVTQASPNITASSHQGGVVPAGIDTVELNRYWLQKINELRAAKNLRQLVLDERWVDTASEYAEYMGVNHVSNHERADGKTMHQWIDTKGLTFTTRNSPGGWTTNYFTENISWNQIQPTTADAKRALDDSLNFYLAEAASNVHITARSITLTGTALAQASILKTLATAW
jgi:SH3-like domain-containing protein/uncharacterized protein YkwD